MEKVSKRVNTEHVNAMTKALEAVPNFTVKKTGSTVVAKTRKGTEVYRALKIGRLNLWTVRHFKDLFSREG